MHTPASAKVLKKILGVKWEKGGRVAGLKLLLTFAASRICQIFGVQAASRVRQFQNQLGFSPRGLTSRAMRQRCGVASTSKAAPLAPHERLPLAAPPPASQSKAAASAACVHGGTAASVAIKSGRVSGLRRRWYHRQQRHPRQRQSRQRQSRQRQSRQRQSRQRQSRQRQSRQRHPRQRNPRRRHPRRRHSRRKGEGKRGQGGRSAWAGRKKRAPERGAAPQRGEPAGPEKRPDADDAFRTGSGSDTHGPQKPAEVDVFFVAMILQQTEQKKSEGQTVRTAPLFAWRNGYLPISPDPASVCFMSDAQALASESDMKPQPLRTFGNTISLLWFLN